MAKSDQKCLFVLGTHRSGTSVMSRVLNLAGAALPVNIMPAGKDNQTGYWEPEKLAHLHDQLLAEVGSSWHDWRALDWGGLDQQRIEFYRENIKQILADEFGESELFVLKEPRICRFVPLYLDILKTKSIKPMAILPIRNPVAVLKSIQVRDGINPNISKLIWLRNVLDAEWETREIPRVFSSFEVFLQDWQKELDRISEAFSLEWPKSAVEYQQEVFNFLKLDKPRVTSKSSTVNSKTDSDEWVDGTYKNLKLLADEPYNARAMKELDEIRTLFDTACDQFSGLQPKLEESNSKLIGMNHANVDLLAENASKTNKIADRDQELNVSRRQIQNLETGICQKEAELNIQVFQNEQLNFALSQTILSRMSKIVLPPIHKTRQFIYSKLRSIPILRTWKNSSMTLYQRGISYWRRNGTGMLVRRLGQEVGINTTSGILNKHLAARIAPPVDASSLIAQQNHNLMTLGAYKVADGPKRLTMVTDSISAGSLFGGVGTALILATQLAQSANAELRIVTRTEPPAGNNVAEVLERNGVTFKGNIDFQYCPLDSSSQLEIHDHDVFLTTSWWTTYAVLHSVKPENVLYLIQEDERMFYPFGDEHQRCSELLKNRKLKYIVNSKLLFDHFESCDDNAIAECGIWFEPAFSKKSYYPSDEPTGKKQFFFYARPNNHRNLFYLGLEAIDQAVHQNILDPHEWEINFVGKDIPAITLAKGVGIKRRENLKWSEYAQFVRSVDLGLSLMYTPHPSYPPLDVAASGGVVVTNRYGNKQELVAYSENIVCADADVSSLVEGLKRGAQLSKNQRERLNNYQNNQIEDDWRETLSTVILECKKAWNNVSA